MELAVGLLPWLWAPQGGVGDIAAPQSLQQSSVEREFVKVKSEQKDEPRDGPSLDLA